VVALHLAVGLGAPRPSEDLPLLADFTDSAYRGGVFGLLVLSSLIGFLTMRLFGIETRQRVLEELSA
jgi:hypothetical protein